jgi:hypothetical protein
MDTLAALFRDVGAPVSVERIELDPPAPTEILVRIAAAGLCRTDYHVRDLDVTETLFIVSSKTSRHWRQPSSGKGAQCASASPPITAGSH